MKYERGALRGAPLLRIIHVHVAYEQYRHESFIGKGFSSVTYRAFGRHKTVGDYINKAILRVRNDQESGVYIVISGVDVWEG